MANYGRLPCAPQRPGQAYADNVGRRLDCHLATAALVQLARKGSIYKQEKFSDHGPVTVEYGLAL